MNVILIIIKLNVDILLYSELDPGLEEAISTVIWVAPRLSADVQELREVYVMIFAVVICDLWY